MSIQCIMFDQAWQYYLLSYSKVAIESGVLMLEINMDANTGNTKCRAGYFSYLRTTFLLRSKSQILRPALVDYSNKLFSVFLTYG